MASLSELGRLSHEEADDLKQRVDRFVAAWKPDGSGVLQQFLPPPGARHRLLVLVRIVTIDMERRAAANLPFRVERYVNEFPDDLTTNSVPVPLLATEYMLHQRFTDKPSLSSYQRWFPDQFEALKEFLAEHEPVTVTPAGLNNSPTPLATLVVTPNGLPRIGTVIEDRPLSASSATLHKPAPKAARDPNASAIPSGVFPSGYQLIRKLGSGAFGEVYEALGPGGFRVAIKRILRTVDHPASVSESEALEAIKELAHPYLLKTNGYWVFEDKLVILMELADCSLADRIAHHKRLGLTGVPAEELVPLFEQTGEALDYLHTKKVSHRDIKPENILLLNGYAKVGDFGLARLHEHTMTFVHSTVGTPAYMAPEMWKQQVSLQSDQYSLAATYVRCRLDRQLFSTNVMLEMAHAHIHETPNLDPIPRAEQTVLLKALAKNPDDRYPTCLAFAKALRAAVFPPPPPPPPTPPNPIPGKTGLGAVMNTVVIAVVCALAVGITNRLMQPQVVPTPQVAPTPLTPVEEPKPKDQPPPPLAQKPFAVYPAGWTPAETPEPIVRDDKRYHRRLTRKIGDDELVALLIYQTDDRGPSYPPFYMLEHKVTNRVFKAAWSKIQQQPNVLGLQSNRPGLVPGKWKPDWWTPDGNRPVRGVTVLEAILVAEELGGSLPSLKQWRKATGAFEKGRDTRARGSGADVRRSRSQTGGEAKSVRVPRARARIAVRRETSPRPRPARQRGRERSMGNPSTRLERQGVAGGRSRWKAVSFRRSPASGDQSQSCRVRPVGFRYRFARRVADQDPRDVPLGHRARLEGPTSNLRIPNRTRTALTHHHPLPPARCLRPAAIPSRRVRFGSPASFRSEKGVWCRLLPALRPPGTMPVRFRTGHRRHRAVFPGASHFPLF